MKATKYRGYKIEFVEDGFYKIHWSKSLKSAAPTEEEAKWMIDEEFKDDED